MEGCGWAVAALPTCKGCSLEQQVRFVFSEMIWTLFRQWDKQNQGPIFDRKRHYVERVIS